VNYEVEVAVDGADAALKPDMTANVSIKTAERQALVIPSPAIVRDGDQQFVYVDEGGRAVKRSVTIGVREGNVTEIKRGLGASDRVLTSSDRPTEGKS
jgi:multidrug efflux pump subunit AcrA (membrane-fusion protein)